MLKKAAGQKGVMGSVVGAGVGAGAYFVAAKLGPKIPFLQGRWWALPTAMLVGGHLAKRYSPESGQAVVGAAGALMAFSYYVQASTSPAAPAKGVMGPGEAGRAYGDAGRLQQVPGYGAGALQVGRGYAGRMRSEAGALVT